MNYCLEGNDYLTMWKSHFTSMTIHIGRNQLWSHTSLRNSVVTISFFIIMSLYRYNFIIKNKCHNLFSWLKKGRVVFEINHSEILLIQSWFTKDLLIDKALFELRITSFMKSHLWNHNVVYGQIILKCYAEQRCDLINVF